MFLVAGFVLFASVGAVSAQNYYVSTNGNDGNTGTSINQAFGTVEHGSSILHAGDTLFIDGGTYWNDKVDIERSGTASDWITVTNYNGENVKMYHDEEFNNDCLIHLTRKSYIKIENIESSHYGSAVYISGKYEGTTHHITINNVDSLRSYSRGYACNAGAHDVKFKDILIKDVQHPWSAPNSFDFLTSPHDVNYKPYSDYMIYNIELINVDLDYNYNHGGFNFGQGTSTNDGSWKSHWDAKLFSNFYFDGCDVTDIAGAGYYTNKGVLHDTTIKNCVVTGCHIGMGFVGDNLLIQNVVSKNHKGNSLYAMWDTKSYDCVLDNFDGTPCPVLRSGWKEINSNTHDDTDDWKDEWYGTDSADGEGISTEEVQHAIYHWSEDKPVRGHILTTSELQQIIVDWQNS